MKRLGPALAIASGLVIAVSGSALAAPAALTRISSDPFTNSTSVHQTEVEPDTFSFGSTIVAAFQVGRFFNGGASDIGFATSTDGGAHWTHGLLPGTTFQVDPNSPYERVSDSSVAFDAKHNVWLISSIPILPNGVVPTIFVSRSTDKGPHVGQASIGDFPDIRPESQPRQELVRLRQHADRPFLRELLYGVRQLR
jgi:hypothetical protein